VSTAKRPQTSFRIAGTSVALLLRFSISKTRGIYFRPNKSIAYCLQDRKSHGCFALSKALDEVLPFEMAMIPIKS
jgi:hypothetical protein